jgi:hypothetical protein
VGREAGTLPRARREGTFRALSPERDLGEWVTEAGEPSLVWRWLAEVERRPAGDPELEAARADVTRRGWARAILDEQLPEGHWVSPGGRTANLYRPKYVATNWKLLVLSELGATRSDAGVARAAERMFEGFGGPAGDLGGTGSEVCFTGNAVRMLSNLGYADDPRLDAAIAWLVGAQKSDGGWHCFDSATGTLDGWEALAAFAALPATRRTPAIEEAVRRGAEFYLSRHLLEEGTEPYEPWRRTHYPVHYYYDFLVGLDTLTRLGFSKDPRLGPALDLLESKRNPDGTWNLDAIHPDLPAREVADYAITTPFYSFALEWPGTPSRWTTITALAVLRRAGRA